MADCGQCSSLLSSWIECQSVAPQGSPSTQLATTAITTSAASASTSSQTLVQSSQDTDVAMAPPPLPSPSPHLAQATHNNNSNAMRFGSTQPWSQHAGTGATTGIPSPSTYSASSSPQSTAPTPAGTPVYVGSEELAHILRSAATNNIVLTQTAPATTSMSSPPLLQHQQQQQRNRQARLSLRPQSTPMAMAMPVSSPSSSIAASRLTARMSSMAPSDGGGQSLQVPNDFFDRAEWLFIELWMGGFCSPSTLFLSRQKKYSHLWMPVVNSGTLRYTMVASTITSTSVIMMALASAPALPTMMT